MFFLYNSLRCSFRSVFVTLTGSLFFMTEAAKSQSGTAHASANCNASFKVNCTGSNITIDFTPSAAPLENLGDHPNELLAILAIMIFFAMRLGVRRKG
ncbi:hypothetical protein [Roseicyclus marinus]|uniref:hypothetical protein n=1 Tax=Roseicyclus marinus TaxID=2161673 RepID=UPI00240F9910|nr:hypothetical protein [Roseicyclus marinus]